MKKCVVINSLSFSGMTWIELMLGTHPSVAAIGPADQSWDWLLHNKTKDLSHFSTNTRIFWESLKASGKVVPGNFVESVLEHKNAETLLIDNPSEQFRAEELQSSGIIVTEVALVRDLRDIVSIHKRRNPSQTVRAQSKSTGWLKPSARTLANRISSGLKSYRFEDARDNTMAFLRELGGIVEAEYRAESVRYWEYNQLNFGGNWGPLSLVAYHQDGVQPSDDRYVRFYQDSYRQQALSADFRLPMTPPELVTFSIGLGLIQRRLGYKIFK